MCCILCMRNKQLILLRFIQHIWMGLKMVISVLKVFIAVNEQPFYVVQYAVVWILVIF